jgi:hypothetical protein
VLQMAQAQWKGVSNPDANYWFLTADNVHPTG